MTARELIAAYGGIASTSQLLNAGYGRHSLVQLTTVGAIERVRKGWYCLPELPAPMRQAFRVGGRLTGLSAAQQLARDPAAPLWVAPNDRLHIAVPANASRLRTRTNYRRRLSEHPDLRLCMHWNDDGDGSLLFAPLTQIVRDAIRCESPEFAATLIDSSLYTGRLTPDDWSDIRASLSIPLREKFWPLAGRCESGTETLTQWRMRSRGVDMQPQVHIAGVGRVDFLIGRRLVIEVDGYTYHADPSRFERDRQRDAFLSKAGYRVLRFSYKQVMERWHEVEEAILAALVRGDHL